VLLNHFLQNIGFTEFRSCALGDHWRGFLLPLMNSFKTKAAIFTMQALLPEGFPFFSDLLCIVLNEKLPLSFACCLQIR